MLPEKFLSRPDVVNGVDVSSFLPPTIPIPLLPTVIFPELHVHVVTAPFTVHVGATVGSVLIPFVHLTAPPALPMVHSTVALGHLVEDLPLL